LVYFSKVDSCILKVLKCGAGAGLSRSVTPTVWKRISVTHGQGRRKHLICNKKKAYWIGQIWLMKCSKMLYWMKYRRDEKAKKRT
jgi:hypothetical protein